MTGPGMFQYKPSEESLSGMPLLTLVNVRNVACNRGRDNVINTEGLNVHIDYKKENRPVQSSREPKRVQDSSGSHLNILQAEERNDIQQEVEEEEEEIVQRPDIEAEILRNIDEDDLRLLDAQPSILNLQTHGLENIQQAGHNRLSQDEEVEEEEEGKTKNYFASLSLSQSPPRLVLVELNCSHNNRTVMMACLQNICQSFCKEDK